jgi:large subunit ribosomal protein L30
MSNTGKTIKVTLFKSPIGAIRVHKACVRGLGLRRMNHTVTLEDTPAVRGMAHKVNHLVRIEE